MAFNSVCIACWLHKHLSFQRLSQLSLLICKVSLMTPRVIVNVGWTVLALCYNILAFHHGPAYSKEEDEASFNTLCNIWCSSSFAALLSSILSNSSPGFGNLVSISVSFLVCSGSDPHFNPYLAVTEINWPGSLSKCRVCTCFASSLKFPPSPPFHYIPDHQPCTAFY